MIETENLLAWIAKAEERSKVYMLLSLSYLERPNEDITGKLRSPGFLEGIEKLSSEAQDGLEEGLREIEEFIGSKAGLSNGEIVQELAVDFTRLFRGIKRNYGPPPPFESVYRDEGRIMGESTTEVIKKYSEADVGIGVEPGFPPDYIGLELRFMALLCYGEATALKKQEIARAAELRTMQKRFIGEHLSAWVPQFCNRMSEEARTGFYRGIAALTEWILHFDRECIADDDKGRLPEAPR